MAFPVRKFTKTLLIALTAYLLLATLTRLFGGGNNGLSERPQALNQLIFVKTHKTGSSTVINLFQRYAYSHQLTVALPRQDDMFLGWPRLLTDPRDVVLSLQNSSLKFDYIINHLVYKESLVFPLVAGIPVRVTVVRQPVEQLRSSFNYYGILRHDKDNKTSVVKHMQQFFSNPERFDKSYRMEQWFVQSRTKNPQLADLGLSYEDMDDRVEIEDHVDMLLNNFNLIMVAELMDESCLLLKRLMRWSLEDILYINKNSLQYPGKTTPIPEFIQTEILRWSWGDNLLYWKAKEMLLKLMSSEPRFQEELQHFKRINLHVRGFCSQVHLVGKKQLIIEATDWNTQFVVDKSFCIMLVRKERPFTRLLQVRQRPDLFNQTYYTSIEDEQLLADVP